MPNTFIHDLIKNKPFYSLPSTATVQKAAEVMAQAKVGAVMIVDDVALLGIFTERDLLTRIVAEGRDPKKVKLADVMSQKPAHLYPSSRVAHAIEVMSKYGFRHVPIIDEHDGHIVGMVSIRDLYAKLQRNMQIEIEQRDAYIANTGYGTGT